MTLGEFRERLQSLSMQANVAIQPAFFAQLHAYFDLLSRWNSRINLTSLRLDSPSDEVLDRLFLEPLGAAKCMPNGTVAWFDIGSGGGSPAIPLKVARPSLRLTMVESRSKKAAFLREAIRVLGLTEADVFHGRFESLASNPERKHSADLLTTRGVRTDSAFFVAASAVIRSTSGELLVFRSVDERILSSDRFNLGKPTAVGISGQTRLDHYKPKAMFHVEQSS